MVIVAHDSVSEGSVRREQQDAQFAHAVIFLCSINHGVVVPDAIRDGVAEATRTLELVKTPSVGESHHRRRVVGTDNDGRCTMSCDGMRTREGRRQDGAFREEGR